MEVECKQKDRQGKLGTYHIMEYQIQQNQEKSDGSLIVADLEELHQKSNSLQDPT